MVSYLMASFALLMIVLWRLMRGVKPELWAVVITLSLAVLAMVMTLVGFLALSVSGYVSNDPLLLTNATPRWGTF